ncbi:MAG: Protein YobA [Candidatus Erwinia impunctatus]|nr:Protein YobA [Culicoides impunctatus]
MIRRSFSAVSFFVVSLFLFSGSAAAHAHLTGQQPAANARLTASPERVSLTFSEKLEAAFSDVVLTDTQNKAVFNSASTGNEVTKNGNQITVSLTKPLPAGDYKVNWHVLSVDGHKTKGTYTFSVE